MWLHINWATFWHGAISFEIWTFQNNFISICSSFIRYSSHINRERVSEEVHVPLDGSKTSEVLLTVSDVSLAVASQACTWHDSTSPSAYFGVSKLNKKCLKHFWMVTGLYLQSSTLVLATTQRALQHKLAINHWHTGDRGYHARCHLFTRSDNHSCMRTPMEEPPGEIWGSLSCQKILPLVDCRGLESNHQPSDWRATVVVKMNYF